MATDPLEGVADQIFSGTTPETEEGAEPQEQVEEGQQPEPSHPILERFGGDVNKLAEAYANADAFIGRQGSEMGQRIQALEEALTAAQQPPEQEYAQDPQQDWPDLSQEQFAQWMEDDPMAASAYMSAKTVEAYRSEIERTIDQRLGPVERNIGQNTAVTVADALRKSLGNDVIDRNMDMLQREMKADKTLLQGEQTQVYKRLRRIVTDAEWERGQVRATQATRGQPGPHVEGGSNGRPPTQSEPEITLEEQVRQALLEDQPKKDPIFGATRRP